MKNNLKDPYIELLMLKCKYGRNSYRELKYQQKELLEVIKLLKGDNYEK